MTIDYGTIIRTRRQELGLTQKEVADRACVHRTTLIDYEQNRSNFKFDMFLSILTVLGLKLDIVEVDDGIY